MAEKEKDPESGIFQNEDGSYTVVKVFRTPKPVSKTRAGDLADTLDSAPLTLRQIAALALAEDAKPVAASYEDCKAANPMFCPYHGLAALKDGIDKYMKAKGLPLGMKVEKLPSGAYKATANYVTMQEAEAALAALDEFLEKNGITSAHTAVGQSDIKQHNGEHYKKPTGVFFTPQTAELNDHDPYDMTDVEKALAEGSPLVDPDEYAKYLEAISDADMTVAGALALKMKSSVGFAGAELADLDMIANEALKVVEEKATKSGPDAVSKALLKNLGELDQAKKLKVPGIKELGNAQADLYKLRLSVVAAHVVFSSAVKDKDLPTAKASLEKMSELVGEYESRLDHLNALSKAIVGGLEKMGVTTPYLGNDLAEGLKFYADHGMTIPAELASADTLLIMPGVAPASAPQVTAAPSPDAPAPSGAEAAASKPHPAPKSADEIEIPDEVMKPLAHDESKFPANLTQAALDEAIAKGKSAGGAGGLNTKKIEIAGKTYFCKSGSGSAAEVIRNGYNCDMAYRAGGVCAPDSKLYEFGGKVYKLAEAIEGTLLIDAWKAANAKKKASIRAELLKGYPLDVLFSNWDVLGTNMGKPGIVFDNVIVGKDGKCWRIDNDGAFGMSGTGGEKDLSWATGHLNGKCDFENWQEKGGWDKREWIDDFRTMRLNPKNKGIFSEYTTADIFLSAGNCNMNAAVKSLPENTRKALAKPLHEMNQMALHAVSANISDYGNREMMTYALDAMYEASKLGMREMSAQPISWGEGGFGKTSSNDFLYHEQPFGKPEPVAPKNPLVKDYSKELKNAEYTGSTISDILTKAAKTINYHMGFVQHDEEGNVLGSGSTIGTPDYHPNPSHIAAFEKIDREKLAEVAKTDENAQNLLNIYDSIQNSKTQGWKTPIEQVKSLSIAQSLPNGFKTSTEKAAEKDKAKVEAKFKADYSKYESDHKKWAKEKAAHEEKEHEKAVASGKNAYANFNDFANKMIGRNIDTNGMPDPDGGSIDFIEHGKDCNKFGKGYSATTKNDSWTPPASKLKVLDLVFRGMSLKDIKGIKNGDPLINNGHHSGKQAKDWFVEAVQDYIDHPDEFAQQSKNYARWKGLQTLKLENEKADVMRPETHSLMLFRKESYVSGQDGTVTKVEQKAANASCGFQSVGCIGSQPYAYDVPLWCVSYTYNDNNAPGSNWSDHAGTENEYVATLIGLSPYQFSSGVGYSKAMQLALATPQFKEYADKRKSRLGLFMSKPH